MVRLGAFGQYRGMQRRAAETLDRADALAPARELFAGPDGWPDGGPIYLDGNSLGRPPTAVIDAIEEGIGQWRDELVGGWQHWIDLPLAVGDRLGRIIGAGPGQVAVCDSTTVNLYKLAAAAVGSRPDRPTIISSVAEFPTDRYVLEGIASSAGRELVLLEQTDPAALEAELAGALDSTTALVCLSHVNYRSGARFDMAAITAAAHEAGALVLWDLSHSAGAVPVELDRSGADLAVGCTYKYLNAGPGAPGYLYVNRSLQSELRQPVWGWFGQADQFDMGPVYRPAPGVGSHLTGTPPVLGLMAVDASLSVIDRFGLEAMWQKSRRLTDMLIELIDTLLAPLGARLATPRPPARRGAHVSVAHPLAWPWCRTLIERRLVVGDFRTPDVIRLGPAPLYTRFVDCYDGVELMAEVLAGGLEDRPERGRVT
jgi:kynureninase